jgi:hypothetical protein
VQRRARGRRVGGRCVAARRSNRRRRACRRFVRRAAFTAPAQAGANSVLYRARHGGRRLRPGRYRLVLRARDAAGNTSPARRAAFRMVRR